MSERLTLESVLSYIRWLGYIATYRHLDGWNISMMLWGPGLLAMTNWLRGYGNGRQGERRAFLRENGISIVYTRGECDNPDLVEAEKNIYLLKEAGTQ